MDFRHSSFGLRHSRASGFTLIELLIVIGIILLLISILLPTANQVRVAAQSANTRQMIARIEAGIQSYYSDFQSYPGPFANGQVRPFNGATAINGQSPTPANVTSSENLFLGLAGGLRIGTNSAGSVTSFTYDSSLAQNQNGPANLNPANLKRHSAYISLDSSETTFTTGLNQVQPGNAAGVWNSQGVSAPFVGDTVVPEIIDKYSRPSPILYVRASRGAPGVLVSGRTEQFEAADATAHNGSYQYQFRQLTLTYGSFNAQAAKWSVSTSDFTANGSLAAGAEAYFGNSSTSSSTSLVPAKRDEFLLISAGPDGKYGTRDDITNFR